MTNWACDQLGSPRSNSTEGQAVWQSGGDEEDSHFGEGESILRLAYDDNEEEVYCDWV